MRSRSMTASRAWEPLEGRGLKVGDTGGAVAALRNRLVTEMPVPAGDDANVFDGGLECAVRLFQRSRRSGRS